MDNISSEDIFNQLVAGLKGNKHLTIVGPAGCGKNWMSKQILEADGRPHAIIDVNGHADAHRLLRDMEGHESDNVLISVMKYDLENEPFVNVLKGLLDRGETYFISPNKSTMVHFTGNIIMTTEEINSKSLVSRFVRIDIPGPKKV